MANELQYYGDPEAESGLTILARVYDSTGTQTGSDVSCTEVGTLAIYQGDMPSAPLGGYTVRFFDGTTLLGQGPMEWDGTNEVSVLDVSQSVLGLNDFDASTTDVTLANNSITSSVIASNAFNNSAFTTGFYNSINAEIDTALSDYDITTNTDLTLALADILEDTNELQQNQGSGESTSWINI